MKSNSEPDDVNSDKNLAKSESKPVLRFNDPATESQTLPQATPDRALPANDDIKQTGNSASESSVETAGASSEKSSSEAMLTRRMPLMELVDSQKEQSSAKTKTGPKLAVALALAVVVGGAIFVTARFFDLGGSGDLAAATNQTATSTAPGSSLGSGGAGASVSELVTSTARLFGLNDDGVQVCVGSGVVVSADGKILTNAHVVTPSETCKFSTIGVGIPTSTEEPPEMLYRAKIVNSDESLDLAVVEVVGYIDPSNDSKLPTFRPAPLGNSDSVQLGESIRVLGFPLIGGDTINFSQGDVSGFTSQTGIGPRAMIKTTASISAGSSGGMAVDSEGRVVGIPTRARASETGPAIDCRPLRDTNKDGKIGAGDDCVPVGGFLNGVRPINFAKDLLAKSKVAGASNAATLEEEVVPTVDLTKVNIANPRFSVGQINGRPSTVVESIPAGASDICLFVDWNSIPNNVIWDNVWYVDNVPAEQFSNFDQTWTYGEDGTNFWVCATQEQDGFQAGLYEVGLFINGEDAFVEAINVAAEPAKTHEVVWQNQTGQDLCTLKVNPSKSQQYGLNELKIGERIAAGQSFRMPLAGGLVVVEAYNCDGELVADDIEGLDITGPAVFKISDNRSLDSADNGS